MPNVNGIDAAPVLKRILPDVPIVVFTIFNDALGSSLSSAVGVDLVVPKTEGLTVLVNSIQLLMGIAGKAKTIHPKPSAA